MSAKQKNYIFLVLILAFVLFYIISGGSVGISLDFGEDALTLSALDRDWAIAYDEIASLELTGLPDLGTRIDGSEKRTLCCGAWENEAWGKYTLCIDPRIEACIVVTLADGQRYALNYESAEATAQLHKMFEELLQSKAA